MKIDPSIRNAIDESLHDVHFNMQDMHRVLRAVRDNEDACAPVRRKRFRLDFVFATALMALVFVPLAVLTLRSQRTQLSTISGSNVTATSALTARPSPEATAQAGASPVPSGAYISADDAVRIARNCYESHCDTSIFTFDEFTVDVTYVHGISGEEGASTPDTYQVTLENIYGNGCTFVVVIDVTTGEVLFYTTPEQATIPAYLPASSPEVQAWYEKNGPYVFTWSQADQVEFSRRYEGAALRAAGDDVIPDAEAQALAVQASKDAFASLGFSGAPVCYTLLYDGRSSADGAPYYVVYCFKEPVTAEITAPYVLVTLNAQTGAVESVRTVRPS